MKDREEPKRKKNDEDARRQGPSNPPSGHTKTPAKGHAQQPQKNPNPRPIDEDMDEDENEVDQRRRA